VLSLSLCLGCTSLVIGAMLSVGMLAYFHVTDSVPKALSFPTATILIGCIAYLPTIVQPFCQAKAYKAMSRMCLGCAIVFLCYGALWLLPFSWSGVGLRLLFLIVFGYVYRFTQELRRRYTSDPAAKCDKGNYPFCDGNRQHLETVYGELLKRAAADDPFTSFARTLVDSRDGLAEAENGSGSGS